MLKEQTSYFLILAIIKKGIQINFDEKRMKSEKKRRNLKKGPSFGLF